MTQKNTGARRQNARSRMASSVEKDGNARIQTMSTDNLNFNHHKTNNHVHHIPHLQSRERNRQAV